MDKHTTAFRTPGKTWEALKELAKKEDRSINWLLNKAAEDLIESYKNHSEDNPQ